MLESLRKFADGLPKSVTAAKKLTDNINDNFCKFVCCSKCNSLYDLECSTEKLANGKVVSKECSFVRFPNHLQRHHRKPCGTVLMKTVQTSSGSTVLDTRLLYCYKSLIESLQ